MIIELTDNPEIISPLLVEASLPDADIGEVDWLVLLGYRRAQSLQAAGGLERCANEVLLRSVVVDPANRGQGLGAQLVSGLEARAVESGYSRIYLLTLDAEDYFSGAFGYQVLDRDTAPQGIRESSQFTGICPASATLMIKNLH